MSVHEWEILAGAILLVIGQFITSLFAQRRETGKRIGRLERRMDIEAGRRMGRAEERRENRRKGHDR